MKIIIYQSNIIRIGGVETFTYNMCKLLSNYYDVELIYKDCHREQLKRLREIVKCTKYNKDQDYKCDILICASSWGGYPEKIKANKYWQVIHANYDELLKINYRYDQWKKTDLHICVSNAVKTNFEKHYQTGTKNIVIHNLLDEIKPTQHILKLISCTRLSGEKGYNRMVKFAEMLKDRGIRFRWLIFTDMAQYNIKPIQMEEIIYMEPRYDIWDFIKEADYGVQFSDTEGYSYFVNECLQYGTAMLVTNFDSVYESVEDGVNGYIYDMELSNIDFKKLQKVPKFTYKPKTTVETWIDLIGKPAKKEKYVYKEQKLSVECIFPFDDVIANTKRVIGDKWEVQEDRAYELEEKKLIKLL